MHLKEIIEGLLTWQDDKRKHFKAKVKLLIEMLINKCGMEAVKIFMPEEHMKLLNNIRKISDRKERKLKSDKETSSIYSKTSSRRNRWNHTYIFSDVNADADDDSNACYGDSNVVTGSRKKASSKMSTIRSKKTYRSSKRLPGDTFHQLDEDPLDLLDGQRTRASLKSSSHLKRKAESVDELEIDFDGRLVIREDGRKTKRDNSHHSEHDLYTRSNFSTSQRSLAKSQRKRQRSDSGWAYTGNDFKSKKGSGDVKRKNKLEPYAYWPLDRKLLNRREENKAIARKVMASLVKTTKKLEGKSSPAALSARGFKIKKTQKKTQ